MSDYLKCSNPNPGKAWAVSSEPGNPYMEKRLAEAEGLLKERSDFYGDEGQLFNKMVEDWKAEGCWSEWDESIYQKRMDIEKRIRNFLSTQPPSDYVVVRRDWINETILLAEEGLYEWVKKNEKHNILVAIVARLKSALEPKEPKP